jgi:Flp pilus assembly CpaF family ATPase
MTTFAEAFPIDWHEIADVAADPEVIGLGLVPPASCLVVRPFPVPPESRAISPETLVALFETLEQNWPLPAGFTSRWETVNGLPLRVRVLRRPLGPGHALDRMVAHDFLTYRAAAMLREAATAGDNLVIAGPSSSARTSLLYACLAEILPDEKVLVVEEPVTSTQSRLSLPANAERTNPIARLGLAKVVREELRSENRPDVLVLHEVTNWAVGLAIEATLDGKWTLWTTVRSRDTEGAVGRLTMLTSSDKLRAAESKLDIRAEILRAFDLIVVMEKRDDLAFVSRISRSNSAGKLETVYKVRRVLDPQART